MPEADDSMPQDMQVTLAVASAWVQLVTQLVRAGVVDPATLKSAIEGDIEQFNQLGRMHAVDFSRLLAASIDSMPRRG